MTPASNRLIRLRVNRADLNVTVDPRLPLLWVLRDELGLVGTKYGCGVGQCGACTVLIDDEPLRSCLVPVSSVQGDVTTIEGLGRRGAPHPVQKAWIEHQVAQCGYCQSGQIVSATALLAKHPNPSDEDIDREMSGILCRCGTYARIRMAIKAAAVTLGSEPPGDEL